MAQGSHQSGVGLQVFISHTGADEQGRWFAASVLKPALEAAGIATYIDYNNLQLGCDWPAELVQAAASSAVVVAVLTRSYATRFWCLRELDLALNRPPGSPQPLVIPVYIDHYSSWLTISADDLGADIQRRINKLTTAPDSAAAAAELCDLKELVSDPAHLQRMVNGNLVSLQSLQAVRRQHQDAPQQLQEQQLQQQHQATMGSWPTYRVSQASLRTMQHRIWDCYWQMRMPDVGYASEVTVALAAYLTKKAEGGAIEVPSIKR